MGWRFKCSNKWTSGEIYPEQETQESKNIVLDLTYGDMNLTSKYTWSNRTDLSVPTLILGSYLVTDNR